MRFSLITISVVAMAMSACGSQGKKETPKSEKSREQELGLTAEQSAALEKEYQNLPTGVLIKVPVDANGKEQLDKAEMRTTNTAANENNVETNWNGASALTNVVSNELDADSSTQSWHDWLPNNSYNRVGYNSNYTNLDGYGAGYTNNGVNTNYNTYNNYGTVNNTTYGGGYDNNYGGGYGNNYGGGYSNNYGGYGNGYYNSYSPRAYSLNYTASYWSYYSPTLYNNNGCNYYYYSRPSCGGYNWCGSQYNSYY